ncbi:triose-phosphate isomerase [Candidatus Cryosericum septentrionale]|nr:triose-phosphate isomerase [Candidatus Cryosericum septentrionale]
MKIVAGNWKMFKTIEEARTYFAELASATPPQADKVRVIVFPNYIALGALAETGSVPAWVLLGAQDVAAEVEGAFTGEVSPAMIRSTGATHVLIGHSERRHIIGESTVLLHRKLVNSLEASLIPVLCVGETLEERNAGKIEEVVFGQLDTALSDVRLSDGAQLIVAYEPVWAIGTGVNATNEQIEQAHHLIREHLKQLLGTAIGGSVAILYGGSVKPANFASIAGLPSVDGGLIGGASLKPSAFAELIEIAEQV